MGMYFSRADPVANKKIDEYLYKQLEVTPEELFDNFHPQSGNIEAIQSGKVRVAPAPAAAKLKQGLLRLNKQLKLIMERIDAIKQKITQLEQRHD